MGTGFAQALGQALPAHGFVIGVLLLSLRLTPLFVMTPLLSAFSVPVTVRVLVVIGLAVGLASGLPDAQSGDIAAMPLGRLIAACATELALGATLSLSILVAFGAVSFAGRLLDVQTGFGMGQVFDPVTQREVPILNSAFDKLGVIVFFLVDGHHALMRGVAYSLDRFPLGARWALDNAAPWVIKQVAGLFTLGIALAAPVMVCLLLVELALGVVARNLPQMNMFVLAVPMKVVVGLAALSLWYSGISGTMGRVYASIYDTWGGIFADAPAAEGKR
jgi:flagellar biosynthetic protein FliR